MRKPVTIFLSSLAAVAVSTTTYAADSIWNHNGSEMLLQANGSERTISYFRPRHGISAQPGQILFQGRRTSDSYQGTAYTFRSGCRPAPYQVSGYLNSETRIELSGAAPQRDGCQVIGYSNRSGNARLVFTYKRKVQPQYNDGYSNQNNNDY